MALSQFLFGRKTEPTTLGGLKVDDKTLNLVIDATISLDTSRSAEVTRNPVENGSEITDHVRLEPLTLSIEGFISDAPLDQISAILGGVTGGLVAGAASSTAIGGAGLIGTGLGAFVGDQLGGALGELVRDTNDKNYPKKAFDQLLKAQEARQPFLIKTFFSKEIYTNMIITSLSFPQTVVDGGGIRFNMTCEQITLVTIDVARPLTEAEIKGVQAAQSAANKAEKGRQAAQEAAEKTQRDARSELAKRRDQLVKIARS